MARRRSKVEEAKFAKRSRAAKKGAETKRLKREAEAKAEAAEFEKRSRAAKKGAKTKRLKEEAREALFKKRSEAAKKGAETKRRLKEAEREAIIEEEAVAVGWRDAANVEPETLFGRDMYRNFESAAAGFKSDDGSVYWYNAVVTARFRHATTGEIKWEHLTVSIGPYTHKEFWSGAGWKKFYDRLMVILLDDSPRLRRGGPKGWQYDGEFQVLGVFRSVVPAPTRETVLEGRDLGLEVAEVRKRKSAKFKRSEAAKKGVKTRQRRERTEKRKKARLSRAAKKGWETRRANEAAKKSGARRKKKR